MHIDQSQESRLQQGFQILIFLHNLLRPLHTRRQSCTQEPLLGNYPAQVRHWRTHWRELYLRQQGLREEIMGRRSGIYHNQF